MSPLDLVLQPLQFAFMQRALLGCAMVGLICAVLGSFIVLRDVAFIGEGLAHGSLAGLAAGFVLGADVYLSGALFSVALALLIGYLRERAGISFGTAIGILFSASAATGILIISRGKRFGGDLEGYLFGDVLAISPHDIVVLLVSGALLLALVLLFFKDWLAISFDPEMAAVVGIPTRLLHYLFLAMCALCVVVTLQTVGILLVTAMLVIPASAALQLTRRIRRVLALAVAFSLFSAVVGLFISFYASVASGASIVLVAASVFAASFILSPRRRTV